MRELAQWIGGSFGTLELIGTPQTIADAMETWLETEACDGFDDFVNLVVPELQRRGTYRRRYEGTTLRENLGVPRPSNRFFA